MANYYTEFSFAIPIKEGTEDDVRTALAERDNEAERIEEQDPDQYYERFVNCNYSLEESSVWVYSEDDGNVEAAVDFTQWFLEYMGIDGAVLITWANTCSKPRLDSFSGGAMLVDKTGVLDHCIPSNVLMDFASREDITVINE